MYHYISICYLFMELMILMILMMLVMRVTLGANVE